MKRITGKILSKYILYTFCFMALCFTKLNAQDLAALSKLNNLQNNQQLLLDQQSRKQVPVNQKNDPFKNQENNAKTQKTEPLSPIEKSFKNRKLAKMQNIEDITNEIISSKNNFSKLNAQKNSKKTIKNSKDLDKKTTENIDSPIQIEESEEEEEEEEDQIQQFGYHIFNSNKIENFQSGSVIPVNNDYLLGPGDRLQIRIWGKLEQVIETEVDAQGNIFLPKAGKIPVSGIRYGNITTVIKKSLENYYNGLEINVALTNLRSIKVFVLGYVKEPGAYDVSSLATVFTALSSAGGPTKAGSLRKIQLKRKGRTFKTIDMYDYLLKGDNREDPSLKPFDTIFVPAIGDIIQIEGEIKQPGIFEIAPNTSVFEAINDLAGGFTAHSFSKRVNIERINENSEREVLDILTSSQSETRIKLRKSLVQNGDMIKIDSINYDIKNSLQIEGLINRPGVYAYKEGISLETFLANCGGIKDGASTKIQIYRYVSEEQRELITIDYSTSDGKNTKLKARDSIHIQSENDIIGKQLITINGAIKKPGSYALLKNMTLSDLIDIAQLENFADLNSVEIYRKNIDGTEEIITVDLTKVLTDKYSTSNISLQNNDQVSIRMNNKLLKIKKVTLSGEFKYPGVYLALENEKLSSIIQRAGGFTEKAFLKGGIFKRDSISKLESNGNKLILEEEKKRLIYDQTKYQYSEKFSENNQNNYFSALTFLQEKIDDNAGRLIINLNNKQFKDSESDLVLENGDHLYIPETPNSVQIVGGVQMPTSILFEEGKKPKFYIIKAGDYSSFAKKGTYYVIKADGSVRLKAPTIEPGDTIYVPEEIKIKTRWLENTNQFLQTIFSLLASLKILSII